MASIIDRVLTSGNRYWRNISAPLRKLPDFLIIGAPKCGTTSLFHAICSHSGVKQPSKKEIQYFDWLYQKPPDWYRSHFPIRLFSKSGEATAEYLFDPRAPQRVKEMLPNIKLIAVLRDPVDRAYSPYKHNIRIAMEGRIFKEIIAWEDDILEKLNQQLRKRSRENINGLIR